MRCGISLLAVLLIGCVEVPVVNETLPPKIETDIAESTEAVIFTASYYPAFTINAKTPATNRPAVSVRINNLQDLEKYKKEIELLQKAITEAEKKFAELHPAEIITEDNIP